MTIRPTLLTRLMAGALFALTLAAAPPPPDRAVLAERSAKRFPQPVRVGDLVGRDVLQPIEAQPVLGHVVAVTRGGAGVDLVIRRGGVLGFGGRLIAVPLEATALLGEHVAVMDLSPEQLDALPTLPAAPQAAVPGSDTIRMALARPFH